jgi:hypothetical protein
MLGNQIKAAKIRNDLKSENKELLEAVKFLQQQLAAESYQLK